VAAKIASSKLSKGDKDKDKEKAIPKENYNKVFAEQVS
jgi:hypothetical protein